MRTDAKQPSSSAYLCLLVTLVIEAGSLPALWALGSVPFLTTPGLHLAAWRLWLVRVPPADALAASARLVATGCAGWLLATTAFYGFARLSRLPLLLRAAGWTTPLPLRHLVDRALALSLGASLIGATAALAATPPPPPSPVVHEVGASSAPGLVFPAGIAAVPVPVPSLPPASAPPTVRDSVPTTDRQHVVVAGDNLWNISAAELGRGSAKPPGFSPGPTDAQIAPYWETVVRTNRHRLRSGDPNLIFPGESIELPPAR